MDNRGYLFYYLLLEASRDERLYQPKKCETDGGGSGLVRDESKAIDLCDHERKLLNLTDDTIKHVCGFDSVLANYKILLLRASSAFYGLQRIFMKTEICVHNLCHSIKNIDSLEKDRNGLIHRLSQTKSYCFVFSILETEFKDITESQFERFFEDFKQTIGNKIPKKTKDEMMLKIEKYCKNLMEILKKDELCQEDLTKVDEQYKELEQLREQYLKRTYKLEFYKLGLLISYKKMKTIKLSWEKLQKNKDVVEIEPEFRKKLGELISIATSNILLYTENQGIMGVVETIKKNSEKQQPFFYIMTKCGHWYLIIQEKKEIRLIDFCKRTEPEISNLRESEELKFFEILTVNNGKDGKIQYNSGCCEMYAIMLPFLILKLQLFNNVSINDLFIRDEGKNTFTINPLIYNAFCELAFDKGNIKGEGEEKFENRIKQLEAQINALSCLKKDGFDLVLDASNPSFCDYYINRLTDLKKFIEVYKLKLLNKSFILSNIIFRDAIDVFDKIDRANKNY